MDSAQGPAPCEGGPWVLLETGSPGERAGVGADGELG